VGGGDAGVDAERARCASTEADVGLGAETVVKAAASAATSDGTRIGAAGGEAPALDANHSFRLQLEKSSPSCKVGGSSC